MDYWFLVINNRHSALEYFFHYNHGLNSNKWTYFKGESSNSLKVYIFRMFKLRGIIWYIIHANRMLFKIWPHLTFGWPFVNISLTIHPTHSKLYIFVILITSRVIWYTWKAIWSILKFWPHLTSAWPLLGRGQIVKFLSKYFLTCNDYKTINNSFSSKWHLSTSSTTSSIYLICHILWHFQDGRHWPWEFHMGQKMKHAPISLKIVLNCLSCHKDSKKCIV